jgi:hypothetical protein
MNSLKMAMRSFAKATSHLFTLLPSAELPSPPTTETTPAAATKKSKFGPATPVPAAPGVEGDDDSGMIDEANGVVLDKLFQTITRYLQSVTGSQDQAASPANGKTGKSPPLLFPEDEINNFVNQLTISTTVPVTTTILQVPHPSPLSVHLIPLCPTPSVAQSNRYKNLTKHLRLLSKGKTKDGKTIDATVQVASSKVSHPTPLPQSLLTHAICLSLSEQLMTVWKNRVMSNATAAAGGGGAEAESETGLSSPRAAASDVTLPSPLEGLKICREESSESISDNPVTCPDGAPSDSPRKLARPTSEMEIVKPAENPTPEGSAREGEGEGLATEEDKSTAMEIAG